MHTPLLVNTARTDRPLMPAAFVFHEPQIGLGSRSSHSALSGNTLQEELSWGDVIASRVVDARERAACLIMQRRSPFHGLAIQCHVTAHSDRALEISFDHSIGNHRRIVVPIASIASVTHELPPSSDPYGDNNSNDVSAMTTTPTWGEELDGSPLRPFRLTLRLRPEASPSFAVDWILTSDARTLASRAPRYVVLYASSLVQCLQWKEYLTRRIVANPSQVLVETIIGPSKPSLLRSAGAVHDEMLNPITLTDADTTTIAGNHGLDSVPVGAVGMGSDTTKPDSNNVLLSSHIELLYAKARRVFADLTPEALRVALSLQRCCGNGVWCVFGHEWLTCACPLVIMNVRKHLELVKEQARRGTSSSSGSASFTDGEMNRDVAPWIALAARYDDSADRDLAIRRGVLWRLCALDSGSSSLSVSRRCATDTEGERHPSNRRSSFAVACAPRDFAVQSGMKYRRAETAIGDRIDSLYQRLRNTTGVQF